MTGCDEARGGTKDRGDGLAGRLLKAEAGSSAAGYAPEGRIRLDPELVPLERNAITQERDTDYAGVFLWVHSIEGGLEMIRCGP